MVIIVIWKPWEDSWEAQQLFTSAVSKVWCATTKLTSQEVHFYLINIIITYLQWLYYLVKL